MTNEVSIEKTQHDIQNLDGVVDYLIEKYPNIVSKDTREGYGGVIVDRNHLVDVATTMRDELGYNYLSSATAVDYMGVSSPDSDMEMVYHAYRLSGGSALVFKTQAPRDNPVIPSLVDVYPATDFQEREAYDLYGIKFEGHPNLKRILLWEGFYGHPMRKDWKEAYYEDEYKPFSSRWPGGQVRRAEEMNPYGKNVKYPADFDLSRLTDISEESIYSNLGLGIDV
ncbi:MAG TPA: NADH-quinone oxidoreductase subunit C, partial [Aggregatilineales bacterium]|nr:NADH-quinone oxidoreductase subunit C [Aggregatilineales bacterium]